MGALHHCPFQRRYQDSRPAYGAAGFSFLDELYQEETVRDFDPLGSRVLSIDCDLMTGCGISTLSRFWCIFGVNIKKLRRLIKRLR